MEVQKKTENHCRHPEDIIKALTKTKKSAKIKVSKILYSWLQNHSKPEEGCLVLENGNRKHSITLSMERSISLDGGRIPKLGKVGKFPYQRAVSEDASGKSKNLPPIQSGLNPKKLEDLISGTFLKNKGEQSTVSEKSGRRKSFVEPSDKQKTHTKILEVKKVYSKTRKPRMKKNNNSLIRQNALKERKALCKLNLSETKDDPLQRVSHVQTHFTPRGRINSFPVKTKNGMKKACSSAVDLTVMQEAHGLIMDMLADKSLPPTVISGLKTVSSLLSPPINFNTLQRPKISPLVALNESIYTSDIDDSPYVGERPLSLPKRLRRSLPPSLIRRMSTTWTTTTSATGMPTLEPQPLRTRSSSFRQTRDSQTSPIPPGDSRSNSPAPTLSPRAHDAGKSLRSHSLGTSGGLSPRSVSPTLQFGKVRSRSASPRGSFSTIEAPEDISDGPSRLEIPSFEQLGGEDSAFDSRKSMTLTIPQGDLRNKVEEYSNEVKYESDGETITNEEVPASPNASIPNTAKRNSVTICDNVTIIGNDGLMESSTTAMDGDQKELNDEGEIESFDENWDPTIKESHELLSQLDEWDYPIFDLWLVTQDRILSNVAYRLFMDAGIFETFRLPVREFMNYFEALEDGYKNKPYHNRVHAADVLHAVYYMCTQQIPGFTQVNPEDLDPLVNTEKEDSDSAFHTPTVTPRASLTTDSSYGILALNLPALELMALFTAAAMHDYDHPGRTNAFLVATKAPQAILYNDRSVLENHHAAQSWNLFFSKPGYNFLSVLDDAEFRRFRFLVVELILATDLKRHFDFLVEFNAKVNDVDAPGINWASESDRLLVAQMCIKLCDISGPTKRKDLHVNWTMRISEEFYEQGDEESSRGMPISPYMDRNNSQLAKLQEGFINHLVAPLCNAYGSAGLLPGQWLDEDEEQNDGNKNDKDDTTSSMGSSSGDKEAEEEEEEDDSSSDGTVGDSKLRPKSNSSPKTRKMVSILTKHLKENHEYWLKTLREEEGSSAKESLEDDETSDENKVAAKPNMTPIREDSEERISDTASLEDSSAKNVGVVKQEMPKILNPAGFEGSSDKTVKAASQEDMPAKNKSVGKVVEGSAGQGKGSPKIKKTVLVEQGSMSASSDSIAAQTPAVVLENEELENGEKSESVEECQDCQKEDSQR